MYVIIPVNTRFNEPGIRTHAGTKDTIWPPKFNPVYSSYQLTVYKISIQQQICIVLKPDPSHAIFVNHYIYIYTYVYSNEESVPREFPLHFLLVSLPNGMR